MGLQAVQICNISMPTDFAEVEALEREDALEDALREKAKKIRDELGFLPSNVRFWDQEYAGTTGKELFDWYQNYDSLKEVLLKEIKPGQRLLHIGAGNSELSERLYDDAKVTDITNCDFSNISVQQQRERNVERNLMTWQHMDAGELDAEVCPSDAFDIVLDKGCLDCMMAGDGSAKNVDKVLAQVTRVLKPGGKYIMITFGDEEARCHYLDVPRYNWSNIQIEKLKKPVLNESDREGQMHYAWILTKNAESAPAE